MAGDGVATCFCEFFDGRDSARLRDAGGASDASEISAGARGGGESADGKETLVVQNDVEEVLRFVARQRGKAAEVHEQLTIAIENDHFLMVQTESQAQTGRGRHAH